MRHLLTTLLSFTIIAFSFAQTSTNSISLAVGPSFPNASFGSMDEYHFTSGFAKTGEHLNICFEHKINTSFALSAMLYGQANPVNAKAFATNFLGDYYSSHNYKFDKGRWLFTGLLVGGSNDIQIFKKQKNLFLNLKSLIGIVYGMGPKFNITPSYSNSYISFSSNSAFGPSYFLSGGLKYNFREKYFLVTNIQYLYVSEIKLNEKTSFNNPRYYPNTDHITPQVSTTNVVVGIGLNL